MTADKTPRGSAPVKACKPADLDVLKVFGDGAKEVAQKAIEQAKGGDTAAMRIVLDRVAPAPSGRLVRFDLPEIKSAANGPTVALHIMQAVARGDIAPDEALKLSGVLEQYRKQIEISEVLPRLAALEEAKNGR